MAGNAARWGLRVRLLEQRDAEAVRDILNQHHATTAFRDQPFSDWTVNEHFKRVLSRPPRSFKLRNEMAVKLGARVNFMKVFGRIFLISLSIFLLYYSSQTMTYFLYLLTYYLLLKFLDYSDRASNSDRIPNGYKTFNLLIDWIWNGFRTKE
ncbi:hypothetical protein [Neorhizobium galegae]|uniref:hypothetical protein n=1 Tax=Neorhizobium galegae TaxID=399 RepID=UPI0021014F69